MKNNWIKPIVFLATIFILGQALPTSLLGSFNVLNPKKISYLIFTIALIQVMGALLTHFLGGHVGTVLSGFLGGLISSTATTTEVARLSQTTLGSDSKRESLIFLSSSLAMLIQGITIILIGTKEIHFSLLLIFLGPLFLTIILMIDLLKGLSADHFRLKEFTFAFLPVLKLSTFILLILSLSKLLESFFGRTGLYILTFITSFFEMHGSIIANTQLHDAGVFGVSTLGQLITLSIASSYMSKLMIVFTLGSVSLKRRLFRYMQFLFSALALSTAIFWYMN